MSDVPTGYIKCMPCGHEVETTRSAIEALTVYTCEACGRTFHLVEGEHEELDIAFWSYSFPQAEVFWYLAPLLKCECRALIELPYSNLPQTDEKGKTLPLGEDPPTLPLEGWSAIFGCRECGRVREYFDHDVTIWPIPKRTEGTYQSGKGVFSVEVPCGNRDCKVPARMFVDIGTGNASEVVALLRSGLFDQMAFPCGHQMRIVPEKFYRAEPVIHRLW